MCLYLPCFRAVLDLICPYVIGHPGFYLAWIGLLSACICLHRLYLPCFWLVLDWICLYVIKHPGAFWLPCFGLLVAVSCGLYFVFMDLVCLLMRPYVIRHPGAFWLP